MWFTSWASDNFSAIRKQQRLITPCPTFTEGGMTVRIRTAARKLFLALLVEIEPSRPLIAG
jgi:hypothetical protein